MTRLYSKAIFEKCEIIIYYFFYTKLRMKKRRKIKNPSSRFQEKTQYKKITHMKRETEEKVVR